MQKPITKDSTIHNNRTRGISYNS